MEKEIKLAAKLYECRDTAKKLYGDDYDQRISEYKHFIKAAMVKHEIDNELKSAMKLIEDCKDMDGAGVATMNILAACVELLEPSKF